MFCNPAPEAAPLGMCKPADVALAVCRDGGGSAWSPPEVMPGSGPSGELIVGQQALALLRRGLFWHVSSPTKVL